MKRQDLRPKLTRQTKQTQTVTYINNLYTKINKIFPWILHELDTQPRNSRPYYQPDPINIPLETKELLQDPRETHLQDSTELSLSNEIDHILNQEYMQYQPHLVN